MRPQVVAARVLKVLEGSRATWQVWHVRAETLRQLRTAQVPLEKLEAYQRDVQRWVLHGFSVPVGVPPELGEPEVLRRPDGQSAHTVHGSQAYTSRAILAAEEELLGLGLRRDGRQADRVVVEDVLAGQSGDGPGLDRSQVAMVRTLATSGCRIQVALAPAGAGKTAALRVLARIWEESGGTVLGLAPTAVAAEELGRATGIHADTLAKHLHQKGAAGASPGTGTTSDLGGAVGPGTLVLIDEAGMAGTGDLAAVVQHVVDAGGSVRLVGDDQQLAAVAAGGIFRDLAEQGHAHGTTATLTELHRFTAPAEGIATLAVRDGDPAGLDHYLDHGRVHAGDTGDVVEAAYAAWSADQEAGLSSLLLAATRDTMRELNQRARTDRLDTAGQPPGREVALADGTRASAGDTVITRRNDRALRAGDGSWVKNGDRWHVLEVRSDGSLSVERHRDGSGSKRPHVTLPAGYAAEQVQLGYASTIYGAQGATVDTTHTVLTGTETRQALYVALSHGRQTNHLYLATPTPSLDDVGPDVQDTVVEPRQVLADVLARDGPAQSATTVERGDAAQLLREAVLVYQDALPVLAQQHLGPRSDGSPGQRARKMDARSHRSTRLPPPAGPARAALGRRNLAAQGGRAGNLVPRYPDPHRGRRPRSRSRLAHRRRHRTVPPRRTPALAARHPGRPTAGRGDERLPRPTHPSDRRPQAAPRRRSQPGRRVRPHAMAADPAPGRRRPAHQRPRRLASRPRDPRHGAQPGGSAHQGTQGSQAPEPTHPPTGGAVTGLLRVHGRRRARQAPSRSTTGRAPLTP